MREVTRRVREGAAVQVALRGVTFDVPAGQTVALLGPPGSGKRALVNLIAALDRPDEGEILVDGMPVHALSSSAAARYRRQIGLISRHQVAVAGLRVIENVVAPIAPYRVDFDPVARAEHLLDLVGLRGHEWEQIDDLSAAQSRRLFLARALINYPRLLLVDEVADGLDPPTGDALLDRLFDVQAALRPTLIIATQSAAAASRCDRVISLRDGSIEHDEIVATPAGWAPTDDDDDGRPDEPDPPPRPRLVR